MGVRTTDLPLASALLELLGNEDIGGGNRRSARVLFTTLVASVLAEVGLTVRERLSANRTYYVRTDGSDSNTGLVDSAGGAFLTIQKAIDVIARTIDLAGFNVTIQVRDGTFTGAVLADVPWAGDGTVTIQGNGGTPANVIVSTTSADAIKAVRGAVLFVRDLELRTTTGGMALDAEMGGAIHYQNVRFGACGESHVCARDLGYIECTGNYAVVGNAVSHLAALRGGAIRFPAAVTVTLSGTPAFSGQFAIAERGGVLQPPNVTFSGSATGKRFTATTNGVIFTNGAGATYFPGDVAGEVLNGGRYDTNIGTSYQSQQGVAQATLTDAATIDWSAETQQCATVTLAGNRTLGAISNPRAGFTYMLRVVQDATGSRTLNLSNAIYKFPGGTEPTLSTAANAIDVLSFYFDGTSMLGSIQKAFS